MRDQRWARPRSSADLTQAAGLQASPGGAGLTTIKVAAKATRQLRFNAGPGSRSRRPRQFLSVPQTGRCAAQGRSEPPRQHLRSPLA